MVSQKTGLCRREGRRAGPEETTGVSQKRFTRQGERIVTDTKEQTRVGEGHDGFGRFTTTVRVENRDWK